MSHEPQYAEMYARAEAIRFITIIFLIGALIVFLSKTWLFPGIREFAASAPCRTVFGIAGVKVLWYGVFVGLPLHAAIMLLAILGWRGYKVLRDGQCPPNGEKVFRSTRIVRGRKARWLGLLHFAACLPFVVIAIWGGLQAEQISGMQQSKPGSCAVNHAATSYSPVAQPSFQ